MGDISGFIEKLGDLISRSFRKVPFHFRLFRFHEDAEFGSLGSRFGELVRKKSETSRSFVMTQSQCRSRMLWLAGPMDSIATIHPLIAILCRHAGEAISTV